MKISLAHKYATRPSKKPLAHFKIKIAHFMGGNMLMLNNERIYLCPEWVYLIWVCLYNAWMGVCGIDEGVV